MARKYVHALFLAAEFPRSRAINIASAVAAREDDNGGLLAAVDAP